MSGRRRHARGGRIAVVVALAAMAIAAPARALTSCSFAGVVGLNFGGYDVFSGAPRDSTGALTLMCVDVTENDMVSVELDRGGASTFTPRRLVNGASHLEFNMFLDAARTVVWGDGTGGTQTKVVHPNEGETSLTVYGRVFPSQNVPAGSYAETITATINY